VNGIEIEKRLLAKKEVVKEFPFGPEVSVYKVAGKMFALIANDRLPLGVNLKCEPSEASALRAEFPTITPGYHMNKTHWNTILLNDSLEDDLFQYLVDESYRLVVSGLKKADRERLLSK
jgi:predicted DNA-binding protein (MmcQ/YjbR family)